MFIVLPPLFTALFPPLSFPEHGWWSQSTEDPWQCLAGCIEITAALRSPDPTQYVTYLPVQVDGSCNGLQHYAALGRDEPGALKVSVCPADRPGDVYSAVVSEFRCELITVVGVG